MTSQSHSRLIAADLRAAEGATATVVGGDAWVVPYAPGRAAWVSAAAPSIRVIDQRSLRSGAPVG